jgi:hypothetical protein
MAYDFPSEWETGRPWNQPEEKKEWNIKDYPEINAIFERISRTPEWDTFWDFAEKNGLIKGGKYDDSSWLMQALPAYEAYKKAGSAESQDKAVEDAKKAQEEAEVQKAEQSEADILNKDYWEWREKYPDAAKEFEASPEWESVANVKMSEGNSPLANAVNKWKERLASEKQAEEDAAAAKEEETNAPATEMEEATKTQEETTAGDIEGDLESGYGLRAKQAEIQQGISDSADAAQQEAYNKYVQNATAGINRSRAGLLADQGTDATQNVQANYNANRQLGTSTQNDYLQKMQQAKAMQQQANNIKAGSFLNTMSGMLQGAGSGAALGAAI